MGRKCFVGGWRVWFIFRLVRGFGFIVGSRSFEKLFWVRKLRLYLRVWVGSVEF